MGTNDVPKSVRIRCDDGNAHRYRAIDQASDFYDVNNSDAVSYACNDVVELVGAVREVLRRRDLTLEQRSEIAATFDEATRGVSVVVDEAATVRADR